MQKVNQRRRSPSDSPCPRQRSLEGWGDNRGSRLDSRDGKDDTKRTCKFCGRLHEFKKGLCPATGKNCAKCSGKNHFAVVCKSQPSQSYRQACKVLDDGSDTEDIFVVNEVCIAPVMSSSRVTSSSNPLSVESLKRDYGDYGDVFLQ